MTRDIISLHDILFGKKLPSPDLVSGFEAEAPGLHGALDEGAGCTPLQHPRRQQPRDPAAVANSPSHRSARFCRHQQTAIFSTNNSSSMPTGARSRMSALCNSSNSVSGAHWVFFLVFDHLARAALWAISRRCSGESAAALASPPFLAPSLDNATACGFFFFSPMAFRSIYASSSREKQYRFWCLTCLPEQAYACSGRH